MIRLDCPRCGRPNQVEHLERGAEEFCTNCDYPLYWAVLDDGVADKAYHGAGILDPSLRRLPGTAGRLDVVGEPCRRCAERNNPDAQFCSRCGLELHPAPAPPPVVELPVPVPEVVEVRQPTPDHLLLLIVIVVLALVAIFLIGVLLGTGWLALTLILLIAAMFGLAIVGSYWRSLHEGDLFQ